MLVDSKGRRYLVRVRSGRTFQSHAGVVDLDELIGAPEGSKVAARTKTSARTSQPAYLALRPTLADVVLNMPRGAQVIYPKDLGAILVAADVFPGARVLESGVGSGALSMTLVRAGAIVTGYEIRPDFADRARANVVEVCGKTELFRIEERDVYEGIDGPASGTASSSDPVAGESGDGDGGASGALLFDRILLDLPEPWRAVPHAESALEPGGILLSYLPSVNQVEELRRTLARSAFGLAETFEVLRRTWHIEGRSVRPDLRMVAHTGFITTARLLGAGSRLETSPAPED